MSKKQVIAISSKEFQSNAKRAVNRMEEEDDEREVFDLNIESNHLGTELQTQFNENGDSVFLQTKMFQSPAIQSPHDQMLCEVSNQQQKSQIVAKRETVKFEAQNKNDESLLVNNKRKSPQNSKTLTKYQSKERPFGIHQSPSHSNLDLDEVLNQPVPKFSPVSGRDNRGAEQRVVGTRNNNIKFISSPSNQTQKSHDKDQNLIIQPKQKYSILINNNSDDKNFQISKSKSHSNITSPSIRQEVFSQSQSENSLQNNAQQINNPTVLTSTQKTVGNQGNDTEPAARDQYTQGDDGAQVAQNLQIIENEACQGQDTGNSMSPTSPLNIPSKYLNNQINIEKVKMVPISSDGKSLNNAKTKSNKCPDRLKSRKVLLKPQPSNQNSYLGWTAHGSSKNVSDFQDNATVNQVTEEDKCATGQTLRSSLHNETIQKNSDKRRLSMDWIIHNQSQVTPPEVIQIQLNKTKQLIEPISQSPQFMRNQSQEMYLTNLTNTTSINTSMGNIMMSREHSRLSPINVYPLVGSSDVQDAIKEHDSNVVSPRDTGMQPTVWKQQTLFNQLLNQNVRFDSSSVNKLPHIPGITPFIVQNFKKSQEKKITPRTRFQQDPNSARSLNDNYQDDKYKHLKISESLRDALVGAYPIRRISPRIRRMYKSNKGSPMAREGQNSKQSSVESAKKNKIKMSASRRISSNQQVVPDLEMIIDEIKERQVDKNTHQSSLESQLDDVYSQMRAQGYDFNDRIGLDLQYILNEANINENKQHPGILTQGHPTATLPQLLNQNSLMNVQERPGFNDYGAAPIKEFQLDLKVQQRATSGSEHSKYGSNGQQQVVLQKKKRSKHHVPSSPLKSVITPSSPRFKKEKASLSIQSNFYTSQTHKTDSRRFSSVPGHNHQKQIAKVGSLSRLSKIDKTNENEQLHTQSYIINSTGIQQEKQEFLQTSYLTQKKDDNHSATWISQDRFQQQNITKSNITSNHGVMSDAQNAEISSSGSKFRDITSKNTYQQNKSQILEEQLGGLATIHGAQAPSDEPRMSESSQILTSKRLSQELTSIHESHKQNTMKNIQLQKYGVIQAAASLKLNYDIWPEAVMQQQHPLKPFEQAMSYETGADHSPIFSPLKMSTSPKFNQPRESLQFTMQAKVTKKAKQLNTVKQSPRRKGKSYQNQFQNPVIIPKSQHVNNQVVIGSKEFEKNNLTTFRNSFLSSTQRNVTNLKKSPRGKISPSRQSDFTSLKQKSSKVDGPPMSHQGEHSLSASLEGQDDYTNAKKINNQLSSFSQFNKTGNNFQKYKKMLVAQIPMVVMGRRDDSGLNNTSKTNSSKWASAVKRPLLQTKNQGDNSDETPFSSFYIGSPQNKDSGRKQNVILKEMDSPNKIKLETKGLEKQIVESYTSIQKKNDVYEYGDDYGRNQMDKFKPLSATEKSKHSQDINSQSEATQLVRPKQGSTTPGAFSMQEIANQPSIKNDFKSSCETENQASNTPAKTQISNQHLNIVGENTRYFRESFDQMSISKVSQKANLSPARREVVKFAPNKDLEQVRTLNDSPGGKSYKKKLGNVSKKVSVNQSPKIHVRISKRNLLKEMSMHEIGQNVKIDEQKSPADKFGVTLKRKDSQPLRISLHHQSSDKNKQGLADAIGMRSQSLLEQPILPDLIHSSKHSSIKPVQDMRVLGLKLQEQSTVYVDRFKQQNQNQKQQDYYDQQAESLQPTAKNSNVTSIVQSIDQHQMRAMAASKMSRQSIGLNNGIKKLNTDSSGKILGEPESGVNSSIFGTASQQRHNIDDEPFRHQVAHRKDSRQSKNGTHTSLSLVGGASISNKVTSPRSQIKAQFSHKRTHQNAQSYNFIQKFIPLNSDLAQNGLIKQQIGASRTNHGSPRLITDILSNRLKQLQRFKASSVLRQSQAFKLQSSKNIKNLNQTMLSLDGVDPKKRQFDLELQKPKKLDPVSSKQHQIQSKKSSVMETQTNLINDESVRSGGKAVNSGHYFQKTQNSNWQGKENLKLIKFDERESFVMSQMLPVESQHQGLQSSMDMTPNNPLSMFNYQDEKGTKRGSVLNGFVVQNQDDLLSAGRASSYVFGDYIGNTLQQEKSQNEIIAQAIREAVPVSPRDDPFNFIKRSKKRQIQVSKEIKHFSPPKKEMIKMQLKPLNNKSGNHFSTQQNQIHSNQITEELQPEIEGWTPVLSPKEENKAPILEFQTKTLQVRNQQEKVLQREVQEQSTELLSGGDRSNIVSNTPQMFIKI